MSSPSSTSPTAPNSPPPRSTAGGHPTGAREPTAAYERIHCWLEPPLQVHVSTLVPFAVAPLVTSRQRPDCTPVMVPLLLMFHCWFAAPVQSQICTAAPAEVDWFATSRHLLPYTVSCWLDVEVDDWLPPPLQS